MNIGMGGKISPTVYSPAMLNNLTQVMQRLIATEITDAWRDAAVKATTDLLVKIDVKRIEVLRQRFELPPECFGFVAEDHRIAIKGDAQLCRVGLNHWRFRRGQNRRGGEASFQRFTNITWVGRKK